MIAVVLIGFYLVAIIAANLAVAHFGPWALPVTAWVLIPFDLCSRDILHERWHAKGWGLAWRMALLIFSGSALSVLLNLGALRVAIASFCAFALAGTVDTIVCHIMYKYGRFVRMNTSNVFSAITDSVVFPAVAFSMFSLSLSATQAGAKFVGGIFWTLVLSYIMRRIARRKGVKQ